MDGMTKDQSSRHDYLPAAGLHVLLPGYDLMTKMLGMEPAYRALIAQAELADGQQVLEIGCGTGNVGIRVKQAHPGVQYTGSDPDPRALARARRKAHALSGIQFDQAYAQQLPYPDGSFDRVLSSMMLHHLDDQVKARAAAEVHRVLRPGGSLHVVDIGGHQHGHGGPVSRLMRRHPHAAGNLGDAIPQLLSRAGFDVAELGTHPVRLFGQVTRYRAARG
jgi:ubiquinone/menaquinone biosynthesis C-methylase UbiE